MDFQSALDYLYSFVNFEAKPAEVYAPANFNLNRVASLLKRLDNPHERYESVHIAGTKGKGSIAAHGRKISIKIRGETPTPPNHQMSTRCPPHDHRLHTECTPNVD